MHFFIMGASGLVGRTLGTYLAGQGHRTEVLLRRPEQKKLFSEKCIPVLGDPLEEGKWQGRAARAEVIVNLVGRPVFTRWNKENKKEILYTRTAATKRAVQCIVGSGQKTKPVLINASAVGYYPLTIDNSRVYTEKDLPGSHFLAQVCQAWEREARQAAGETRVVLARFAPVIFPGGGICKKILPVFKAGLGGKLGKGVQPFPWIHIMDLVRALELLAREKSITGPVNMVAPQKINNIQFTEALARAIHRPAVIPVPSLVLKLLFGELSQVLAQGTNVQGKVLQAYAFRFVYPTIYAALAHLN